MSRNTTLIALSVFTVWFVVLPLFGAWHANLTHGPLISVGETIERGSIAVR
jgi:hypothetical protein